MTRRDNGLPAVNWQHLTDLAPPLADQVLEELRDEGIPAYATPAIPTRDYLDARTQPRPTDRVFVERDDVTRARTLLDRVLPALQAELDVDRAEQLQSIEVSTDDEVWAGIVAAYSAPPADPIGRWSVAEEADGPDSADAAENGAGEGTGGDGATRGTQVSGFEDIRAELDALAAAAAAAPGAGPADDPIDHFVPPPPPPLPEVDVVTRMAWVALIGGPLFLLLGYLLGWGAGGFSGFVAVIAFVGGFITLVTRMRTEPPDDDDGAQV